MKTELRFCPKCESPMEEGIWEMGGGFFVDFDGNERFIPKDAEVTLYTCQGCNHREVSKIRQPNQE